MISHQQKCIFVHIPKTGGQSVEKYFMDVNGFSQKDKNQLLLIKNTDPNKGPARLAHMRAHEYRDCGHVSAEQYQDYFTFAIVRNPFSRLVSEFLHKKYDSKFSFKHFVFEALPEADDFSDAYRHIIPQSDYVVDSNGQVIVDFIGRFESLGEDFVTVCNKLQLNDTKLPHVNSTSSFRRMAERKLRHLFRVEKRIKKNYKEYYDNETIEQVARIYKSDIHMFNYQFE